MESKQSKQINPWLSIWTRPQKTMSFILKSNPKRIILWLAIIGGVVTSISWLGYLWPARHELHHVLFVIVTMVIGGLMGIVYLYLGGWLYQLTGSWLGGKGDFVQLKCAVGWANYPFIVSSIFSILSLLVIPNIWLQTFFGLLNVTASIWGFIIFMNLLGAAHQFSAWKGVLSFLITFFLVFVVLMIISLLVPLLSPLFVSTT